MRRDEWEEEKRKEGRQRENGNNQRKWKVIGKLGRGIIVDNER